MNQNIIMKIIKSIKITTPIIKVQKIKPEAVIPFIVVSRTESIIDFSDN